ncbi:MAG: hypothetical protein AAGF75_02015 [Cyanobacteria bacterium P01_H01_bin.130]
MPQRSVETLRTKLLDTVNQWLDFGYTTSSSSGEKLLELMLA